MQGMVLEVTREISSGQHTANLQLLLQLLRPQRTYIILHLLTFSRVHQIGYLPILSLFFCINSAKLSGCFGVATGGGGGGGGGGAPPPKGACGGPPIGGGDIGDIG